MKKLVYYVSDDFLDEFKTNFNSNYLPLYLDGDKEKIKEIFSNPENVIESSIEFDYADLFLESEDPDANKKNMKIIWESLKHLSISEASNEKLWIALENTFYLDYHLDQLKLISGKTREASVISRTIFNRGNKRSLMINNIASLWWIAYYTINPEAEDPFYLTNRFMEGTYRGNAIAYFSSNLVSNKNIVLGTLEAIYELIDEGKMIENRYSYSSANKLLNLTGGVVILDLLSKDEIKKIVKDNLLKMENVETVSEKTI
ncbi:DUF6339 family protein [Granulicatella sp. 20925_1_28]|jgi:hypothetical protein|uniref:DUF6339 family protein n=1 Tax=Granulicatella sp. 20925_1_28 TaxID=3003686 RepID=UPI00352CE3AE